ncbi:FecR family protein, partial [Novosphingobium sp.]|uniref:FecR family protein n=1 Tax=Novosphingobium sp. TaxID=1874826 RepID=UPI002613DE03
MPNAFRQLTCLLLLTTASSAYADGKAASWTVSETAGTVTVSQAGRTVPATRGMVVLPGATLSTGAGSRAIVVRGRDFVTVAPGSRINLPVDGEKRGFLTLVQEWGNAIFQVEKQAKPHFGVRTPYLAAVVKGTTFSITVGAEGASLQVVEGLVETSTLDGGASELIRPGTVALVRSDDPYRLSVQGQETRQIDSPQRAAPRPAAPAPSATPAPSAAPSSPSPAEPAGNGSTDAGSNSSSGDGSSLSLNAGGAGAGTSATAANASAGTTVTTDSQVISMAVVSQQVDLSRATAGLVSNGTDLVAVNTAVRSYRESTPANAGNEAEARSDGKSQSDGDGKSGSDGKSDGDTSSSSATGTPTLLAANDAPGGSGAAGKPDDDDDDALDLEDDAGKDGKQQGKDKSDDDDDDKSEVLLASGSSDKPDK